MSGVLGGALLLMALAGPRAHLPPLQVPIGVQPTARTWAEPVPPIHADSARAGGAPLRAVRFPPPRTQEPRDPEADRWLAPDKARHFFLSFGAASLAHGVARTAGLDGAAALGAAGGAAVAAGVWKELRDRRVPGETASGKDLAWDLLGVAAALALLSGTR